MSYQLFTIPKRLLRVFVPAKNTNNYKSSKSDIDFWMLFWVVKSKNAV
jgi:hypothetical protein